MEWRGPPGDAAPRKAIPPSRPEQGPKSGKLKLDPDRRLA
jgi:hypothetical protein